MQSVSKALSVFHEQASWFARAHEIRLLVVRTSGDLRKTVLKLLPMYEFHADNFSPWVTIDDAHTTEDRGWQARADRLRLDWERRREAFVKEGVVLRGVLRRTASDVREEVTETSQRRDPSLLAFRDTLADVQGALQDPLRGLVLILAPSIVHSLDDLVSELELLLLSDKLARTRFVLVLDIDFPIPQRLLDVLGKKALQCQCLVDPKVQEQDIEGIIAAGQKAVGAGPRGVIPPRRIDDPPQIPKEQLDAELRKVGINPEFLEQGSQLRGLLLGAALDMSRGRGADAVAKQRQAAQLCEAFEAHQTKVICQVTLACYLSGTADTDSALAELDGAVRYAAEHDLPKVQSQAHLALALHHAVAGRIVPATEEYTRAAQTAEIAKVEMLAIEAWRMAGQIALQGGMEDEAVTYFQQAIRVAEGGDPRAIKASSAPETARRFAQLCKQRGLAGQAESLYDMADRFERGETAVAAAAGQDSKQGT